MIRVTCRGAFQISKRQWAGFGVCFLAILGFTGLLVAAEPVADELSPEHAATFKERVEPVLKRHCFSCHSHASGKNQGGLMLDSRGAMLAGGDSGPALAPGNPEQSLLVTAVRYQEDYPRMPPKGKLPDDEVATLVEWVRLGAPWPGSVDAPKSRPQGKIRAEDRAYWAFQPVRRPAVPEVADAAWSTNPVDRFIAARRSAAGLSPSPAAEKPAMIRRVYYDLTGLPPTTDEIDAFLADTSPMAYEQLVDHLLASARYGERWARHWLDLVRYAESDGYRIDDYRPNAWRYRDYVIRSLNDDKPYDQFVREQLAGDELAPEDPDALLATSFLTLGIYEYNNRDVRTQWANMLNDVTDVTADVFLGLGLGCARCHDHKFDPLLQRDYFRLQAFLAPMQPQEAVPLATRAEREEYQRRYEAWEQAAGSVLKEIAELEAPFRAAAEKGAREKFPQDIQELLTRPYDKRTPLEKQLASLAYRQVTYEFQRLDTKIKDAAKQRLVELRKQLAEFASLKPEPLPTAPTVSDVDREAPPVLIPKRGSTLVEPAFLEVLGDPVPEIAPVLDGRSSGRRTALARWLTRPENPLTARVMVNRVWQYHFGQGLVTTASDFGKLGEPPSHPELLDWLTANFVDEGWSLKKLHRLLVTSQTYRQSALAPVAEAALRIDPENRLLWRMPTRRLDAEQVRDALLATVGKLDLTVGGPATDFSKPRRSIYSRVLRNTHDPLLDVFDAPEGFQSAASRNVTTTPTQALLLINSTFMLEQAKQLAARIERETKSSSNDSTTAKIATAFRLVFGREPTTDEHRAATEFLSEQQRRIRPDDPPPPPALVERMPFRDGSAVVLQPAGPMRRAEVPESERLPTSDFTVEAFVVLRSTYDDATVRTIAAHWNGDKEQPGWSFGVTSRRSQFKPQMLVLQLWGDDEAGKHMYEPIFSSLNIQLNKPYFVAVTVRLVDTETTGVTFYAKDLSNDDEPLLISQSAHRVVRLPASRGMFTIGGCGDRLYSRIWDGLVDDVRLSNGVLSVGQLLLTAEQLGPQTVGYWEFEPQAGVFKDSSSNRLDIEFQSPHARPGVDPEQQAWIDFCHVLLNTNEFIYVD